MQAQPPEVPSPSSSAIDIILVIAPFLSLPSRFSFSFLPALNLRLAVCSFLFPVKPIARPGKSYEALLLWQQLRDVQLGIGPQKQASETKFYIRFEQTHHTTSAASVL